MKSFPNKAIGAKRNYTLGFSNLPAGVTITSCSVTAVVRDESTVPDTNPSAILNGDAQTNAVATTVCGAPLGAHLAVIQSIWQGVVGCTYLLTFTVTLSNAEVIVEEYSLYVSKYAPRS
jgi:hypothetical protein